MALRLSKDVLDKVAEQTEKGARHPLSSAVTCATAKTAKTASTINIHSAGDNSGYVAYGIHRVRAMQDSLRVSPYQKLKLQAHASARGKAMLVGADLLTSLQKLDGLASPTISVSPSTEVPESPLPASEFEDATPVSELHRERTVSVERRHCKDRPLIFKRYFSSTMPTHHSLHDQQMYELNLYYKDLRGLSNVVQIEGHFYDESQNLTFVFPDLGANLYPKKRCGIVSYMRQLLMALDALWHRDIIHCNIKGGNKPNAIFDREGKLTLLDFESAVRRHELIDQGQGLDIFDETLNYRGNPHYVAPEVLVAQPGHNLYGDTRFGRRRDVFSAGIVFAELLLDIDHLLTYPVSVVLDAYVQEAHGVLRSRIAELSPVAALSSYGDFLLDEPAFNDLGADLVVKMLTWDRVTRPSPQKLLQHPIFRT